MRKNIEEIKIENEKNSDRIYRGKVKLKLNVICDREHFVKKKMETVICRINIDKQSTETIVYRIFNWGKSGY